MIQEDEKQESKSYLVEMDSSELSSFINQLKEIEEKM